MLSLLENVAILISLVVLFDLLGFGELRAEWKRSLLVGGLFGAAAIVTMAGAVEVAQGFVHDSRATAVALSGFLAGPLGALVSAALAGGYRALVIGGAGVLSGLVEVLWAAVVGILGKELRVRRRGCRSWAGLFGLGLLLNGGILTGYFFFLPQAEAVNVVRRIALEELLLFPAAFAILGRLFLDRAARHREREERESLLMEIHHRVKNNLQVISSLISLQVAGASTWEEAFGALQKTRDRINTMGVVHNLLYESASLSQVDVGEFCRRRVESLASLYGDPRKSRFSVSADPVSLHIERAVPFSIILSELVTNAFKHAFPDEWSGTVTVTLTADTSGSATLTVADDGIGLPWGRDPEPPRAMGLQLCRLLAEQIDGELTVSAESGSEGELRFPTCWRPRS